MTKDYVLVDIRQIKSQINGGHFYRLTWVCLDDMTRWETDVQDNYRNWEKNGWRDLVENRRWGVYHGLRRSTRQNRREYGVVTADSYPDCIIPIDTQDLAVEVVIREQERLNQQHSNQMFDQIFVTA
jgi:hypothetical protein